MESKDLDRFLAELPKPTLDEVVRMAESLGHQLVW